MASLCSACKAALAPCGVRSDFEDIADRELAQRRSRQHDDSCFSALPKVHQVLNTLFDLSRRAKVCLPFKDIKDKCLSKEMDAGWFSRREEMDADQKSGCLKREVWSCDDGGMD
ncbi:hypothetical protein SELMODRAFT_446638 [Selaginella moellendorffii]|uniref:Uncharacterized protein n=1 Tax=Selaginella moellendorffii TaxID=88036 RepID=D8ST67_SELML|nr:hypothetical protein SELMODRAFT_446638 [Selaginella moellendorffii]